MATDVLDERHFTSQCSLYEPSAHNRLATEGKPRTIAISSTSLYEPAAKANVPSVRRVRYSTQMTVPISSPTTTTTTNHSIQHRNSVSTDIITVIRSFALKPFKTSSMTHAISEGQTSNIIGGNHTHTRPPVSLLRYRPLSDNVINHSSFVESTRQIEDFLKRLGWPTNSTTDDARVKWNTAMKFLIPVKFDVNRALTLYRSHETIRKNENLDRIWINNPLLAREIQSNKFFTLEKLSNQPLTAYFTAAHLLSNASSEPDRELIALQALICQLDVATESMEVQQSGLNFIYDMQTCSASQFDMNLSKKILKLLQGSYPAMVKNIFIISAPKWFKIAYKVTMHSPDQMRDILTNQFGYSLDNIPISLGGSLNPLFNADNRYQTCLAVVTNSQSICHSYYSPDYQPMTTKSSSNILFFNTDHHPKTASVTTTNTATTATTSTSPASLVAIVALRRNHESAQHRAPKRESSSSNDSEKRRRSNESLIEEELPTYIPQESPFE